MKTRILPLAVLSIALAACDNSQPETDGYLSMEEVAERANHPADAVRLKLEAKL